MFETGTSFKTVLYTAQATNDGSFWSIFFDFLMNLIQLIEDVLLEVFTFISRFVAGSDPLTVLLLITCAIATLKLILRARRSRYETMEKRRQLQN